LLGFEPLDLTLQDITNEGCPSLSPNQFINSVAESAESEVKPVGIPI